MQTHRNYFELFGLPLDYRVNLAQLAERYRQAQRAVHPDRHAGSSEADRRAALQLATLVNTAHLTLQDPLQRAIYMLELKQVSLQENPPLPPAFLMAQIALREELEATEAADSQAARLAQLASFRASLNQKLATAEDSFAEALGSCLQRAETLVYELQFLHKLAQEASALEERLADS